MAWIIKKTNIGTNILMIFLQIREGRIKTAALPSVHFSYQEETQGKIDDGVQCVAENLGISCI